MDRLFASKVSWSIMLLVLLLTIAISAFTPARADIGIKYGAIQDGDGGQMVQMFANVDVGSQALGWYIARSYDSMDNGNIFVGVDYDIVKPFGVPVRLGIGPMFAKDRVRQYGEHLNMHLMAGIDLTKNIGLYFDHWSNCRTICNNQIHTTYNPPRDVVSVGLKF